MVQISRFSQISPGLCIIRKRQSWKEKKRFEGFWKCSEGGEIFELLLNRNEMLNQVELDFVIYVVHYLPF